jgi:hypothetical protein
VEGLEPPLFVYRFTKAVLSPLSHTGSCYYLFILMPKSRSCKLFSINNSKFMVQAIKKLIGMVFDKKPKVEIPELPVVPRYVSKRHIHGVPHLIKKH